MKPLVLALAGAAVVLAVAVEPAVGQGQQGGGNSAGAAAGARTGGGGDGGAGRGATVSSASGGGSPSVAVGSSGGSYSGPPAGWSGPQSGSSGSSGGMSSFGSPYSGGRVNPADGRSSYVREMYGSPGDRAVPRGSRPNPGAPVTGQAVLRPNPPIDHRPGGGGGWYPYYPYYPYYGWGFGAYYGYWDPYWWWTMPVVVDYGYGYGGYYASDQVGRGGLKLKVEPATAEVYVDGYYMGTVSDFDGTFQRLELETGAHHIEIRAPGYQTITFDVRIEFNQTVTYRGELQLLSKR